MPCSTPLPPDPNTRQARDGLSTYLDRALRGERTEISFRGRHIANIVWGGATSLYGMDQQGYFVEWEGPPTRDQLPQTMSVDWLRYWQA